MRLRSLATATALALTVSVAPTMAAEAASKPTYKVSISTSKAKADVGQTIKVSGKVSGPKAAKKRLAVQLKVGKGAWKTVKKVKTTKKRRYSISVKVSTAGKQYLRVVAPKSAKARAGKSKSRSFVGWRWLDLTKQKFTVAGNATTAGAVKIAGKTYPKALKLAKESAVYFDLAASCDTFKSSIGLVEGNTEDGVLLYAMSPSIEIGPGSPEPVQGGLELTAGAAPKSMRLNVGTQRLFAFANLSSGPLAAVSPTAHCTVNTVKAPVLPF